MWNCQAKDIFHEEMTGCPRCGELFCLGDNDCDMSPEWHEEALDNVREASGRPDASFDEVQALLSDPGVVCYLDPIELEVA